PTLTPIPTRRSSDLSIANILEFKPSETISALIRVLSKSGQGGEDTTWQQPGFVFFATKLGTVKKTALEDFANVRKGGIIAIGIEDRKSTRLNSSHLG